MNVIRATFLSMGDVLFEMITVLLLIQLRMCVWVVIVGMPSQMQAALFNRKLQEMCIVYRLRMAYVRHVLMATSKI